MKTAIVTGSAGFIGYHVSQRLLNEGYEVIGVDNFNNYYNVDLKHARSMKLFESGCYSELAFDIEDAGPLDQLFAEAQPELVVHLAAAAGVRHSTLYPEDFTNSNLVGTFNVLEAMRNHAPNHAHLMIASTSSVYGANTQHPYSEMDKTDLPVSYYGATKKATESMAHSYAHLYKMDITMFRFFTVYGPWGRPDMTPWVFADKISKGEPIDVYGEGEMWRDWTYIDDLVESIYRLSGVLPRYNVGHIDSLSPVAPFRVVNIGLEKPVKLLEFIEILGKHMDMPVEMNMMPMQLGDPVMTHSTVDLLEKLTEYKPTTTVDEGVKAFVDWYKTENPLKDTS